MQYYKKSTIQSYLFFATSITLIAMLVALNQFAYKNPRPPFFINMQNDAYQFNKATVKALSLGQERMISSLLWVATLMNLDLDHYKKKDLNSWPYLRFDLIASLDEKFYENYLYGAQYLSVVKDDLIGSENIYKRGLHYYPEDYLLNFSAGYHFYFELSNISDALRSLKVAAKSKKAPVYLPSLIARIESERNNLSVAYNFIFDIYNSAPKDGPLKQYYKTRLYDVKATKDLQCLNAGKSNCEYYDFDGNRYIQKEGKYVSLRPISPLKVFRRKKN
jgi:hypothetical protein